MNSLLAEIILPAETRLQLAKGDLTDETTESIVNAANEHLQHGAGVAGAIVRRGGPKLEAESLSWVQTHGPVCHEVPAWTSGGNLPAKYVIHAVGPVWGTGGEDAKLAAAITGSLRVADELGLQSIAFPAISTGIFGFPKELAAQVMLKTIQAYFANGGSTINLVRIVLYDVDTVEAFQRAWPTVL